jgi:hypothetical protein
MTARALAALLVLAGCDRVPPEPIENTTPSPNASILPAPLASIEQAQTESPASTRQSAEGEGRTLAADGAAPQVLRGDQAPDDDSLAQRELQGVTLDAEWRYPEAALPPKAPEVNLAGIEAARRAAAAQITIHLASAGRMRVTFDSRTLPLSQGAEIRARSDLLGHVLVWPSGSQYRVLPPGAVRTLLGERRVDAVPLVRPQIAIKGEGAHRAGFATRIWELSTRTGKLFLEVGKIAGAGEGSVLFCRFLAEIIAVDPLLAPCAAEEVPLHAHYVWPDGGSITLDVTAVAEKVDFSAALFFQVPPQASEFTRAALPPSGARVFLTREELAAFRVRPPELIASRGDNAPEEALMLHNGTDAFKYAFLDTVPVAWVAPNHDQLIAGLPRGRYVLQWRTFLGDTVDPPVTVELPAHALIGIVPDAGRDR